MTKNIQKKGTRQYPNIILSFNGKIRYNTKDNITYCYRPCQLHFESLKYLDKSIVNKLCKTYNLYHTKDGDGIRFTTIGTSKCHNDDKFNKDTGRHIAEIRAKCMAYDKVISILSTIDDIFNFNKKIIDNSIDNLNYISKTEKDRIKILGNVVDD